MKKIKDEKRLKDPGGKGKELTTTGEVALGPGPQEAPSPSALEASIVNSSFSICGNGISERMSDFPMPHNS